MKLIRDRRRLYIEPDASDMLLAEMIYSIIAKKLKGGSFEAELKKYVQNEKNAIKRK